MLLPGSEVFISSGRRKFKWLTLTCILFYRVYWRHCVAIFPMRSLLRSLPDPQSIDAPMKAQSYSLLIGALLALCTMPVLAGTTGKIAGRVIDATTRDGLPGATVIVEGASLGASADNEGYYTIINVPPGTYSVALRLVGYARTVVRGVNVSADRTTNLDIRATSEEVSMKEVVVQAERPPIQRDKTYSGAIVGAQAIEAMPVTTVAEVISQQAGVVSSGGELHFRGGRGREVAYMIDGIPVSNAYSQSGGTEVSVENSMVQEIAVLSGTFNAEYGSAQSGVVSIVTRPPAPTLSGSASVYAGDWVSNRQDVFLGVTRVDPLSEKDIQMTLSGPLLLDNLGFFISARHNRSESPYWYQRRFHGTGRMADLCVRTMVQGTQPGACRSDAGDYHSGFAEHGRWCGRTPRDLEVHILHRQTGILTRGETEAGVSGLRLGRGFMGRMSLAQVSAR